MSFGVNYNAWCRALAAELRGFTPYTMVTMVEFGKVGEYTPIYADLKTDVLDCIFLFRQVRSDIDFSDIEALPPHPKNRMIDEALLNAELTALRDTLIWLAEEVDHLGQEPFDAAWRRLEPQRRRDFEEALQRAGVAKMDENPHQGESVYVSARIPVSLARQIVPAIRLAGMAPVTPLREEAASGGGDWSVVKRHIEGCTGGVVCFLDQVGAAAESGIARLESRLSDMLHEIAEADRRFPKRLLVVTRENAGLKTPDALRDKAIFALKGETMDLGERDRFGALIMRHSWR